GGTVVLLSGSWSATAGRVLGAPALVGVFSVAALCCAALIGRRTQWFGLIGAAVAVATGALSVWLVWDDDWPQDPVFQVLITLCVATAVCALASLLLLLADHRQRSVRVGLALTLALLALGFVLTLGSIWEWIPDDAQETYWRVTGVAWILAALGVVVLPVLSLLLRDRPA